MKNVWQYVIIIFSFYKLLVWLYIIKYNKNDLLFFKTTSWWYLGKRRRGMENEFVSKKNNKNSVQYNISYTIILTSKHLEILTD